MRDIIISKDLTLPADLATQTIAIVARKRVGKTYTASVIAEELIKTKVPIVVLDPTGAWWGLRSSADGESEGYPVVIIGGQHGDVPLESGAGKIIADLVVDHPGYYVIDFSQLESEREMEMFAMDFGTQLYARKSKKTFPMTLIIDEADCFCPQQPFPEQTRMLHAYDVIVRRGGIRGIGVIMITQRPAVLNKNVLTQCETLIALQISGTQDVDAVENWTKRHGTKEEREIMLNSLASLQMSEAWFWSPSWIRIFKKIHIRQRTTFNSSATPKMGETQIIPKRIAAVDLEKLGDRIRETMEKSKSNDPDELKKTITEQQRKIREFEKAKPVKQDPKELGTLKGEVKTMRTLLERVMKFLVEVTTKGFPETASTEEIKVAVQAAVDKAMPQIQTRIDARNRHIESLKKVATELISSLKAAVNGETIKIEVSHQAPFTVSSKIQKQAYTQPVRSEPADIGDFKLNSAQARILDAIAWYESIGKPQPTNLMIGVIALVDATGGHFSNLVGPLSTNGLIVRQNGCISLTEEGRKIAKVPNSIVSIDDYHDMLCERVRKVKSAGGKTVEILKAIIANGDRPMKTEEIGQVVQMDHTGGHFSNMIGPLSTLGLITRDRGIVTPTEVLFPKGLV